MDLKYVQQRSISYVTALNGENANNSLTTSWNTARTNFTNVILFHTNFIFKLHKQDIALRDV